MLQEMKDVTKQLQVKNIFDSTPKKKNRTIKRGPTCTGGARAPIVQ